MRAVKIVHEFSKKVNGCFELAFSNRCQNVSNVSNYDDGPSFLAAQNIEVFYDFRKVSHLDALTHIGPGKKFTLEKLNCLSLLKRLKINGWFFIF